MAIQPIDLQTLYSQLGNVAKTVVHQQQGMQLANSIRQTELSKQDAEKNSTIQELSAGEEDVLTVKDRHSGADTPQDEPRRKRSEAQPEAEEPVSETYFKDPDLGHHIDISG